MLTSHFVQLALALAGLGVLLVVGFYVLSRVRGNDSRRGFSPEESLHNMLTELREAFDRGDLPADEYHRVRSELMERFKNLLLVSPDKPQ